MARSSTSLSALGDLARSFSLGRSSSAHDFIPLYFAFSTEFAFFAHVCKVWANLQKRWHKKKGF
jgi:hypothetical protein